MKTPSALAVYDLLEYYDSYVADLEWSLQHDKLSWRRYQRDPEPFLVDMLSDFGTFPAGVEGDEAIQMARTAVRKHLGR